MKKTLKAVALVVGLSLLSAPVASYAAGTTAVQYHNQWVKKGSYWTYYNAKGALQKGWLQVNNKWYYFDAKGYMKTGWVFVNNKWYYLEASGAMKTGWAKISNLWYFLDGSGAMKTGWLKSGQDWYFLNSNGAMKTGWLKSGQNWYFLNSNGAMRTGWLQSGGKWYFLDRTSGKMALNWKDIDGKTYYFFSNGAMAANTTIDGKQIGADGAVIYDNTDVTFKNIEGMARTQYGLTVEYDDELELYTLHKGDELVGAFRFDGSVSGGVYGDPAYGELWKKIALELGVPATEAELNGLIEQARQDVEVITDTIYVLIDEETFVIAWGIEE
ncbi:hypothetical protein ABES03_06190 [Neobacillus rhizosphaerae]|uniref:hypothetical protein n=1 Tax=Neobacillus rhizosphaerae TaxID=2880965 RepID=UPI003D28261F